MSALTLKKYLEIVRKSIATLSKEVGVTRQTVYNWIDDGATVEMTDIGIKIKTEKVVYETQVAK